MADLGWLRSSPAKVPANGSLSSNSSLNSSGENLFDLMQGRIGSVGAFGSSSDTSPFFRSSEQLNDTDSTSLLKSEDDNLQADMNMQPNMWTNADSCSLGSLSHGLYNSALHTVHHHHPPGLPGIVVDSSSQFASFSSIKPHDPSLQLQALRDFMAYGPSANSTIPRQPNVTTGGLIGPPMFLHLEETSPGTSLLQLPGMPQMRTFVGESSSSKPDMMAYRALCQAELFATERSPHRTQFQRENHILAERQRREEMNEKFSALRAMIPKATKKDKASIVGDTIGYVLELEKTLKHLQACKASRKTYFKLLKRKSSLKKTASATPATDRECDISMIVGTTNDPNSSSTAAGDDLNAVCNTRLTTSNTSPQKQCQELQMFEDDSPIISSADTLSASDTLQVPRGVCTLGLGSRVELLSNVAQVAHTQKGCKEKDILRILPSGSACNSEVDVQNLGEQAVIKIVCARSPGLVLRILLALDECKVDVLQSNVTTVAEKSVHFITVQISSGLSSTTEEMIAVLHKASSSPSHMEPDQHLRYDDDIHLAVLES